jgi:hypothetical protein
MEINIEQILNRFKIIQSPRLFDVDETKFIKQGICPICECNLKVSLKGDIYCNSAKHKRITRDRLFITQDGFKKLSPK